MTEWLSFIYEKEQLIRLGFFLGILVLFAGLESVFPRKVRVASRLRRWVSNIGIVLVDVLTVRLLVFILPVGFAVLAQEKGWGVFNYFAIPSWVNIALSLIFLDLIIYFQHRVFHMVPVLWRLHRVHHSDLDLDVTSGNRFHPIEILLSIFVKLGAVFLLGPLPVAVVLFEIILNGMAQFNHANLKLPLSLDSIFRAFVVTPDMHRVHHSVIVSETHRNFGFNLSIWDRIFGSYQAQPKGGHEKMKLGVSEFRDEKKLGLGRLLVQPFL